jgi:glycine/D-amino acid oxidase-like deaminating enzyme
VDAIRRRVGDDCARDFADYQRAAIDRVAALRDAHAIDADAGPRGELLLAHRARADAALQAEAEAGRADGLEHWSAPMLAERGLSANGMHGALFTPHGFPLHPLKYARGLAHAAQGAGAVLHGQTPVTRLDRTDGVWRLTTPNGTVTVSQLLVATNGYSSDSLPPWMSGRFLPVFTAILVTRPLTEAERAAQGWTSQVMSSDTRDLLHYFRLLPCGRFLFGMRGGLSAAPRGQAAIRQSLRQHFAALFPAWAGVQEERIWSGLACLTGSLAPFVGPVPGTEGLHAAFGWHGNGVAAATEGGLRAAEVIAGGRDRIPALLRKPPTRLPLVTLRFPMLRAAYAAMTITDGPLPRGPARQEARA